MDLHHADKTGDWTKVPPENRNYWQRLAARTSGIVTPANGISIVGGLLGAAGLVLVAHGEEKLGIVILAIGRLADIADGIVAQATGTKSPVGEMVDATIDKLMCAGVLLVFTLENWLPLWIALLLALHTLINSVIGLVGNIRKLGIHPTFTGKAGATLVWMTLIGFGILQLTNGFWHALLAVVTWAAVAGALVLSYISSFQYGRAIRRPR